MQLPEDKGSARFRDMLSISAAILIKNCNEYENTAEMAFCITQAQVNISWFHENGF